MLSITHTRISRLRVRSFTMAWEATRVRLGFRTLAVRPCWNTSCLPSIGLRMCTRVAQPMEATGEAASSWQPSVASASCVAFQACRCLA